MAAMLDAAGILTERTPAVWMPLSLLSVIPTLFTELFPPIVAAFLAVGILSAILSTSDGLIVSISQILANNLYRRTFAGSATPTEVVERNTLLISRVGVFFTLAGAVAMSWNPPEFLVILLWIGIGGIVSGMVGPILVGNLWRRANKTGTIASFMVGVVGYALIYTGSLDLFGVDGNPFAVAGHSVMIASAVMAVVALLTRPLPEEFVNSIFGERRGFGRAQSPALSRTSANEPEGSGGRRVSRNKSTPRLPDEKPLGKERDDAVDRA